jgi:hypothetical protein
MAEPAIGFDNTNGGNQNTDLPSGRPFPTPIPTNDNNVKVVSTSPILDSLSPKETIREVIDSDGEVEAYRVSNISQNGYITLYGDYSQNSVDIPQFDLSSINVINDEEVTFKFILCLKDGINSESQLFATSETYNKLQQQYKDNNPIPTNYLINQRKIVVVDIQPIKQKVEDLRIEELNLDINLSNVGEKDYVTLFKNLFVNSNYESDDVTGYKANPTYDIIEVLRYISWVVSKPPQNYNDRVLPADLLGQWGSIEDETPSESEPSIETTNEPNLSEYPPIGRKGRYDEEEAIWNNRTIIWLESEDRWTLMNKNGDPIKAFTFKL